jgi:uncharacterized protein YaaQ
MLLLVAIVQSEDAPALAAHLVEQKLRLTQINSSGGLFGAGNVALLLGLEEERYADVIQAIHATCKTRLKYINPWPSPEPTRGAVVFGVPVERFLHVSGGTASPVAGTPERGPVTAGQAEGEGSRMKLMVAIVQGDDADNVIRALVAAGHRLTRINTTGGFLRRGNATLLIGVEAQQVDAVIELIHAACRPRSEAAPLEKGIPEYAANVFVLDASHFVRV